MEEITFKEMQDKKFKAKSVDKRILHSTGDLGNFLYCLFSAFNHAVSWYSI